MHDKVTLESILDAKWEVHRINGDPPGAILCGPDAADHIAKLCIPYVVSEKAKPIMESAGKLYGMDIVPWAAMRGSEQFLFFDTQASALEFVKICDDHKLSWMIAVGIWKSVKKPVEIEY